VSPKLCSVLNINQSSPHHCVDLAVCNIVLSFIVQGGNQHKCINIDQSSVYCWTWQSTLCVWTPIAEFAFPDQTMASIKFLQIENANLVRISCPCGVKQMVVYAHRHFRAEEISPASPLAVHPNLATALGSANLHFLQNTGALNSWTNSRGAYKSSAHRLKVQMSVRETTARQISTTSQKHCRHLLRREWRRTRIKSCLKWGQTKFASIHSERRRMRRSNLSPSTGRPEFTQTQQFSQTHRSILFARPQSRLPKVNINCRDEVQFYFARSRLWTPRV
jgi:hypothetical protein